MRIERKSQMAELKKVKLSDGPDKTVTWIWLDPEKGGRLKVEYYDSSESAQKLFGLQKLFWRQNMAGRTWN
jgi:hypothetical protein